MINITKKVVRLFDKKDRSPEAVARETEIKIAIRALKGHTDRELSDMGIARSNIENAVRFGNAVNDTEFNQNSVA